MSSNTEHVINILADISDVEAKVKTILDMLKQVNKEIGKTGSSSKGSRRTKKKESTDAKESQEAAKAAEDEAKAVEEVAEATEKAAKSKRKKVKETEEEIEVTEELIAKYSELIEMMLRLDDVIGGGEKRARGFADFVAKNPTAAIKVFEKMGEERKAALEEKVIQAENIALSEKQKIIESIIKGYQDLGALSDKLGESSDRLVYTHEQLRAVLEEMNKEQLKGFKAEQDAEVLRIRTIEQGMKAEQRLEDLRSKARLEFTRRIRDEQRAGIARENTAKAQLEFEERIRQANQAQLEAIIQQEKIRRRNIQSTLTTTTQAPDVTTPLRRFTGRFEKVFGWMSSVWSLFALVNAFKSAISVIVEMEKAMIDLQKVMDDTTTNFDEMRKAAIDLGKELGQFPTEVARAMFLFARQGFEQAEILDLTRTALIGVNVAELDLEQSTRLLTASMLQLGLESWEMIGLLDAWNEVSNKNAVSVADLGEAFSLTASLADSLGLSIHELNALVTILASQTGMAGSRIGRTLRFAFTRAFSPEVVGTLGGLGISVFEAGTSTMRPFAEILREISDRWQDFNDAQKQAIAFAFGSTIHVQNMRILFENLAEQGMKVATESMNSFGSAVQENEKYMRSVERQFMSLKASATELVMVLGDSGILGVLQGAIDIAKMGLAVFNLLPKPVKTLAVTFGVAYVAGRALTSLIGNLTIEVNKTALAKSRLVQAITAYTSSTSLAALGTSRLVGALRTVSAFLTRALGVWGLLASALMLVGSAYNAIKERIQTANERQRQEIMSTLQVVEVQRQRADALANVRDQMAQLSSEQMGQIERQQRQNELLQKANDILPGIADNYDLLAERIDAATERQYEFARSFELSSQKARDSFIAMRQEQIKDLEREIESLREAQAKQHDLMNRGLLRGGVLELGKLGYMSNLDAFLLSITGKEHEMLNAMFDGFEYINNEIDRKYKEIDQYTKEIDQIASGRTDLDIAEAFARSASDGDTNILRQVFGDYIVDLEEFRQQNMQLAQDIDTVLEYLQEQVVKRVHELRDAQLKYFELTGRGLQEYIDTAATLSQLEDEIAQKRMNVARTLLDEMEIFYSGRSATRVVEPGSEEYFHLLTQINEAQSHFTERLRKQEEALKGAFDAGALSASEFYAQLTKLERSDAFRKMREEIRKMNEELRTGTVNAIKQAFSGLLRGEENFLERFQESIRGIRADALATGLTQVVTSSDYFELQTARQQHMLAALFGGDRTDYMKTEDKQFITVEEMSKRLATNVQSTLAIQDGTDKIAENTEDIAESAKESSNNISKILAVLGSVSGVMGVAYWATRRGGPGDGGGEGGLLDRVTNAINNVGESAMALEERLLGLGQKADEASSTVSDFATTTSLVADKLREEIKLGINAPQVVFVDEATGERIERTINVPVKDVPAFDLTSLLGASERLERDLSSSTDGIQAASRGVAERTSVLQKAFGTFAEALGVATLGASAASTKLVGDGSFARELDGLSGALAEAVVAIALSADAAQRASSQATSTVTGVSGEVRGIEAVAMGAAGALGALAAAAQESASPLSRLAGGASGAMSALAELTDAFQMGANKVSITTSFDVKMEQDVSVDTTPIVESATNLQNAVDDTTTALKGAYTAFGTLNNAMSMLGNFIMTHSMAQMQMLQNLFGLTEAYEQATSPVPPTEPASATSTSQDWSELTEAIRKLEAREITWLEFQQMQIEGLDWSSPSTTSIDTEGLARQAAEVVKHPVFWGALATAVAMAMPFSIPAIAPLSTRFAPRFGPVLHYAPGNFDGGFTGRGGKLEPAGIVHKGEWVAPAWMVQKYGDDIAHLESIRRRGFASGGSAPGAILPRADVPGALEGTMKEFIDVLRAIVNRLEGVLDPLREIGTGFGVMAKEVRRGEDFFSGRTTSRQVEQLILSMFDEGDWDIGKPMSQLGGNVVKRIFGGIPLFNEILSVLAPLGILYSLGTEFRGASLSRMLGFQSGGHTGTGNIFDAAGVVHKGEYVIPAWMVKRYPETIAGLESVRRRGYQSGGPVMFDAGSVGGAGPSTKELLIEIASANKEQLNVWEALLNNPDLIASYLGGDVDALVGTALSGIEVNLQRVIGEVAKSSSMRTIFGEHWRNPEKMATLIAGVIEVASEMQLSTEELVRAIRHWDAEFTEHLEKAIAGDEELVASVKRWNLEIKSLGDALLDSTQIANMLAGFIDGFSVAESPTAALFSGLSGLIQGTSLELAIGQRFAEMGLKNQATDILSGLGMVLSGMQMNVQEAKSGVPHLLAGVMSMFGPGLPFAQLALPVLEMLFGRRQEEQKEAQQIGNVRHFITQDKVDAHDRFYMSGRHAFLLSGRSLGGGGGDSTTEAAMARGVSVQQSIGEIIFNIDGSSHNPKEIANEVMRKVQHELPKRYSREIRRGLRDQWETIV